VCFCIRAAWCPLTLFFASIVAHTCHYRINDWLINWSRVIIGTDLWKLLRGRDWCTFESWARRGKGDDRGTVGPGKGGGTWGGASMACLSLTASGSVYYRGSGRASIVNVESKISRSPTLHICLCRLNLAARFWTPLASPCPCLYSASLHTWYVPFHKSCICP